MNKIIIFLTQLYLKNIKNPFKREFKLELNESKVFNQKNIYKIQKK